MELSSFRRLQTNAGPVPLFKVIIDAMSLLSPLAGIGRYTFEVSRRILSANDYDCRFFYGYISNHLLQPSEPSAKKNIRSLVVRNPWLKSVVRRCLARCCLAGKTNYDLYWQPNFIPRSEIRASRVIATVHDFSWEIYPEFHPKERIAYFQENFYSSIKRCDHIITVSEYVKEEVIRRVSIKPENISVIHNGIDHGVFLPRKGISDVSQKYLLAVGSIEPRKNLRNLLLAYGMLDEQIRDEYNLILVGPQGWNNLEILNLISSLSRWVKYSGYVSDEELADLYSNAALFIYPSVYEGFGIPPLEAMACGAAVIASNASSLPEVCSDAAYYVDPMSPEAIMNAILKMLHDDALRNLLIEKGLSRARKFSWEQSAAAHKKLFDSILNQGA